jgi:hypothetical protein
MMIKKSVNADYNGPKVVNEDSIKIFCIVYFYTTKNNQMLIFQSKRIIFTKRSLGTTI